MTLERAVALSLLDSLPRRHLTSRLLAGDPALLARALALVPRARDVLAHLTDAGVQALAWNDPRYPASLLAIADCPPVLWCRGDLACLDAPRVAIVGSRAASAVALELATRLGDDLAAHGVTVVSGLARGVDSAAHRGALRTGRTIAVLGSGVDRIYPSEHTPLADAIAASGLLVTECPPGTEPRPFRFPLRNRLISGLSRAVVVIEASDKSGSLITAAHALEQGREVMAVPGNVLSGRNRGGHALIRDGATIVECGADVIAELGLGAPRGARAATTGPSGAAGPPDDPLLRAMDAGQPYDLDALAASSGMDVCRLLPRLMEHELRGVIRRTDAGRFIRPL